MTRAGTARIIETAPERVSLEDAVIDAAVAGSETDAFAIVGRALQERRTTPDRLLQKLRRRARARHRTLLVDAIGDSADGAHSALEHRYLNNVERAHALPGMTRQYIVPEIGHRADAAAVSRRLLIELDGVRYHDPDADRSLDNKHAALGYQTLRFRWGDVTSSACTVARTISDALQIELPRRCGSCPRPT